MTRSASGTYSLPSACMKSYWVSTSQKMTRAMARNLSEDTGACQPEGGRAKALPGLKFEHYCDLVTAVVARAPHAVGPHLEREVLALGGREPELDKKLGFAGQREDLCQAVRPRLGNQRREQGTSDARPLPILPHRERGELRQVAGVHLERPAPDDLARRRFRDYVLLDMAAEIVVRTWQQVAAFDVRSHQDFQLRHVGESGQPPEPRAQPLGLAANVGEERRVGDRAHHLERHTGDERPAAERGRVVARLERPGYGVRHEDRPHWQSSGERFSQRQDVGNDAGLLVGEQGPRPAQAALYLVEYDGHAAGVAQLAHEAQPLGVHGPHPALPLHRLDDDRRPAGRRYGVNTGCPPLPLVDDNARGERLEPPAG